MLKLNYAVFLFREHYDALENDLKAIDININENTKAIAAGAIIGSIASILHPVLSFVTAGTAFITSKMINHNKNNELPLIKPFCIDDIPKGFSFVNDFTPTPGVIYVACNYKPNYYIPLADFQEQLVMIKEEAIQEMMRGLGAKTISWTKKALRDSSIEATITGKKAKIQFQEQLKKNRTRQFNRKYDKPSVKKKSIHPFILDSMEWSKYQDSRFEDGALTESEDIWIDEDDFSVGASIAENIKKQGIGIGGAYKYHIRMEYDIRVEYWNI